MAPLYDYGHFHWSEKTAADEAAISTLEHSALVRRATVSRQSGRPGESGTSRAGLAYGVV